jgi:CheY-like chemotaxis protein
VGDQAVILLVDDREEDVLLVRLAFQRASLPNPLYIVRDGEEAMSYLSGEGKYGNRAEYPLPDLMLLDLRMPRIDGFQVLQWLRQQPGFGNLPVIVLTSSEYLRDVDQAYKLGANSFMIKPLDFQNFLEMNKYLSGYWRSKPTGAPRDPRRELNRRHDAGPR